MKVVLRKIIISLNKLQPTQTMVIGFASLILIGAILLNLPIASKDGNSVGFLSALFTSTSAVCVTGLVVVDTATHWTLFGQVVIIGLIQIGGLGFMTATTLFALITRKKINLRERLLLQESLNQVDLCGLVKLTRSIIIMTFSIEGIGAILLSSVFIPQFGFTKGIWYSIFHSISGFCNAGFDLMGTVSGPYSSLTSYVNSFTVTLTLSALILFGGIGFPVIIDVIKERKWIKLSVHTKIVLLTTAILLAIGALMVLAIEYTNPNTLGGLDTKGKFLASFFQSVIPRTAGFNSIDLNAMHESTAFTMVILMFIGASPASTGGGIKITTLAVIILSIRAFIRGKDDIEVYGRRIEIYIIRKSLAIFFMAVSITVLGTLIITLSEANFSLLDACFEVVSAFATVGSSLGGSANLSIIGRIVIIICMFMGRVGSMTILMAIYSRGIKKQNGIRYPEGKIIVG